MKLYILGNGSIGTLLGYSLSKLLVSSLTSITFLVSPNWKNKPSSSTLINNDHKFNNSNVDTRRKKNWHSFFIESSSSSLTVGPSPSLDELNSKININKKDAFSAQILSFQDIQRVSPHSFHIPYLIITTKAHQTEAALRPFVQSGYITSQTHLLLLQNGWGQLESVISTLFSPAHISPSVCIGSTTHGAYRTSPFCTVHAGQGEWWFSPFSPSSSSSSSPLLQLCAQLPSSHLLDWETMNQVILKKLAISCMINPITAYYRLRNGSVLHCPSLLSQLANEVALVYQSKFPSLPFGFHDPDTLLAWTHQVCRNTSKNWSSMYMDIQHSRKTEIQFINGTLLRWADQLDIPVPFNKLMYDRIRALESNVCP